MKSAAALLMVLAGSVCAQQPSSEGVNFYSVEREIALGKQLAANLHVVPIADPDLNAYLAKLGAAVSQSADSRFQYTFTFYDDRNDPARSEPIALAGGPIFVPVSLLANAPGEAAFAFQLAHAVAHIALRHYTRMATKANLMQIGTIPLRNLGDPAIDASLQQRDQAPLNQFVRSSERAADYLAVSFVAAAGYDPRAVVPARESASDVKNAIAKLPARKYDADSGQFAAMKSLANSR